MYVNYCSVDKTGLISPEMHGLNWRNISLIVCVIRVFSIPLRDN